MKKQFFLYCTLIVLLSIPPVSAQEATANGVPVHTIVTVEAKHGNNPPDLSKDDVMVSEGHNRDQVTDWTAAKGDRAALELFIMIDDGSNMSLGTQLEDVKQFITSQPGTAKVGVAYMQNGTAQIVQNLTTDHAQAAKSLRLPLGRVGADGSPYFSLQDLIKRWPQTTARREVVMITDGVDWFGGLMQDDPYVAAAIEDAQRAGIPVYDIYTPGQGHMGHSYWAWYWGQYYLSEMASATGGESYYIGFSGSPVNFTPYLEGIAQHLSHQYWLGFLAKPEKKAGMKRVRIQTEVPNADLVSQSQVYVPAEAQ